MFCGAKFQGELGLLVGATPQPLNGKDAQLESQMQQLRQHLMRQHPREYTAIDIYAANYKGFLLLSNFRSSDPRIQTARDKMRWAIHRQTSNATIPDEKIEAKTQELVEQLSAQIHSSEPEDSDDRARTIQILMNGFLPILKGFRNELQEPGKYPPVMGENRQETLSGDPN